MGKKSSAKDADDSDDDEVIGKGKDKRFDGSQDPLAVSRMIASLEQFYRSLDLNAHVHRKWVPACLDSDLDDFIPPAILPKMLPRGSGETLESFQLRKGQ